MNRKGVAALRLALATFVTFVAVACSNDRSPITGARPRPTLALRDNDPNPVIASATGHWEVIGGLGNLNKVSVSAIRRLDGTVTGEMQYEQFTDDGKSVLAHGNVICLEVEEMSRGSVSPVRTSSGPIPMQRSMRS